MGNIEKLENYIVIEDERKLKEYSGWHLYTKDDEYIGSIEYELVKYKIASTCKFIEGWSAFVNVRERFRGQYFSTILLKIGETNLRKCRGEDLPILIQSIGKCRFSEYKKDRIVQKINCIIEDGTVASIDVIAWQSHVCEI